MITVVIFFLLLSLTIVAGSSSTAFQESFKAKDILNSKKSLFLAEAGAEDVVYRIIKAKDYDNNESLQLDGHSAITNIQDLSGTKEVMSTGDVSNLIRKVKVKLFTGSGASFYYGIQVGDGGLVMENNSRVSGNVFSNGPIRGENSNIIEGNVVSAGPTGLVDGVHATGTVYSHNILNSQIDGNAYYVNILNTNVRGSSYGTSPDQSTSTLPISDDMIANWETVAATSVINAPCPYIINSDVTIGLVKINCSLEISGTPVVTLSGPVWVVGDIDIKNSSIIKINQSLGGNSVAIIADNPSNRLTSGKVVLENSVQFQGSGTDGSYIMIISQNNSAESGGGETAVDIKNSVSGDLLLYAGHGEILIQNSVDLKEVTGYKIKLKNYAHVIYESGLTSLLFTSGPSGGYSIGDWGEI